MGGVLAFDLSPSWCGYCAGDGGLIPTAGAWKCPEVGSDLGALACHAGDAFRALIERYRPDFIAYESPILLRHDALMTLRRVYGLGWELERVAREASIPCGEVDLRRIKSMLTGDPHADKKAVAAVVDGLGVILPRIPAEGRFDAADAFGCWMVTMAEHFPAEASLWLVKLRGSLI